MKNRSFKEYVANRFENELYDTARRYILANRMQPEFTTRKIEYPSSTDVDSIRVMGVEVNDLPDGKIEFIVTIEAVLYIYQKGSRWDKEDECYPWLKIRCTATDWMERQANALAPKILMPMDMFKRKSIERIKHYQKALNKTEIVDVMEPVITDLSAFYNVSLCAAKIRLVEAGYEEAIGVYTYIDGHYVRPYHFKKGSITRKQTFTIGVRDVAIQRMVNRDFAILLETGEYIFVENHM